MSLLPPPGPQRTRVVALMALLGVALVVLLWRGLPGSSTPPAPQTTVAQNGPQPRAGAPGKPATGPQMPVPVNLDKLEPVPDEPGAGRNLFRYGMPPPPPPPPPQKIVAPPPVIQSPPPQPPGPPAIDLQLKGITRERADTPAVAWLKDPKTPDGRLLFGSEGQIVDGKYKILKVGTESVIVSYVDGTQPKTILISR